MSICMSEMAQNRQQTLMIVDLMLVEQLRKSVHMITQVQMIGISEFRDTELEATQSRLP